MKNEFEYDVKQLQAKLNVLGFNVGKVDGIEGKRTKRAIIAFKKSVGLRPRSLVGPVTWDYLMKAKKATESDPRPTGKVYTDKYPPLARPFLRRLGWQEGRDKNKLLKWFRQFGGVLGDPTKYPWCGEGMENSALEMFPKEDPPENPYWARAWAEYGVDAGGPVIGSIGVIGWKRGGGHVGVVSNYNPKTKVVTLIGCNQGDSIKYSNFALEGRSGSFIAFRVPASEKGKIYRSFGKGGKNTGYGATR